MKLSEWCNLASVIGELEGMSTVIGWSGEEVEVKKIKDNLDQIAKKLKEIFESERNKLEDVVYAKKNQVVSKKQTTEKGGAKK